MSTNQDQPSESSKGDQKDPRIQKLLANPDLMSLLQDPIVQQNLSFLYDGEKASKPSQHDFRNQHKHQFPGGNKFPNPNLARITALEAKIIEGGGSPEQEVLRQLLKHALEDS